MMIMLFYAEDRDLLGTARICIDDEGFSRVSLCRQDHFKRLLCDDDFGVTCA